MAISVPPQDAQTHNHFTVRASPQHERATEPVRLPTQRRNFGPDVMNLKSVNLFSMIRGRYLLGTAVRQEVIWPRLGFLGDRQIRREMHMATTPKAPASSRGLRRIAVVVTALSLAGIVGQAGAQTAGPTIPKAPPTAQTAAQPAPKPAAAQPASPPTVKRVVQRSIRRVSRKGSPPRAARTVRSPKASGAGGFGQGAKGDKVLAVQTRLAALKYDIANPDGSYGDETYHAVMAFQKVNGLRRSGRVDPATLAALDTAIDPVALLPTGGADRVEVDLTKQFLALYKGGNLFKLLSISSGSGKKFCVFDPETKKTECDEAITPGGSFRVRSRWVGWRESKLGLLFNPLYFNGGIAIHGAPSVPGSPASHGCVRIPMTSSVWFPNEVVDGTPVYVFGGKEAPVPLKAKAPANAKSSPTTAPQPLPTLPAGGATQTTILGSPTTTAPTVQGTTTTASTTVATTAIPTTTGVVRVLGPTTTVPPATVVTPTLGGPTTTVLGATTTLGQTPTTGVGATTTSTTVGATVGTGATTTIPGAAATTTVAGAVTTTAAGATTTTTTTPSGPVATNVSVTTTTTKVVSIATSVVANTTTTAPVTTTTIR